MVKANQLLLKVIHSTLAAALILLATTVRAGVFLRPSNSLLLFTTIVLVAAVAARRSSAVMAALTFLGLVAFAYALGMRPWDILAWWPHSLGFLSVLWLPVLLLALILEAIALFIPSARIHPSTAVAAAFTLAFLHPIGADTSTTYDGSVPPLVAAFGYLILVVSLPLRVEKKLHPALAAYLVVEPVLLVSAVWFATWLFPYFSNERGELAMLSRYYLPGFAIPASCAILLMCTAARILPYRAKAA